MARVRRASLGQRDMGWVEINTDYLARGDVFCQAHGNRPGATPTVQNAHTRRQMGEEKPCHTRGCACGMEGRDRRTIAVGITPATGIEIIIHVYSPSLMSCAFSCSLW